MKNYPPELTADLLIELFENTGKQVIQINRKSMWLLSGRKILRKPFLNWVRDALKAKGFILTQASDGKYGLYRSTHIDNAIVAKCQDYLPRMDRKRLIVEWEEATV